MLLPSFLPVCFGCIKVQKAAWVKPTILTVPLEGRLVHLKFCVQQSRYTISYHTSKFHTTAVICSSGWQKRLAKLTAIMTKKTVNVMWVWDRSLHTNLLVWIVNHSQVSYLRTKEQRTIHQPTSILLKQWFQKDITFLVCVRSHCQYTQIHSHHWMKIVAF